MNEEKEMTGLAGKKKIILLVLGIIVVVAIGFLFVMQQGGMPEGPVGPETPGPEAGSPPETGEPKPQTAEEANALVRQAIDNQDSSYCEEIKSKETRDWCKEQVIIAEAMVTLDSGVCEKLANETVRAVCRDSVIVNRAVVEQNPGLCDTLMDKERVEQCKKDASPL